MSIMDIFKTRPATTPAAGNPDNATGNVTVPSSSTATPSGTGPGAFPAAGKGDESPLAGYAKLWENDPKAPPKPSDSVVFNADPAKMLEAAGKIDFASVIPKELAEKALKGDPQAFMEAMNKVTQATYAQSAGASTKLIEQALAKQVDMFKTTIIPDIVRQTQVRSGINSENQILANPAISPVVEMLQAQLIKQNPTASADVIQAKVTELMKGMSTEIAKSYGYTVTEKAADTAGTNNGPGRPGETDWSKFLGA